MKKVLIVIIVIIVVFILTSVSASAFSFVDVFRFLNKGSNQEQHEEEKELDFYQKQSAEDKYENWKNAFNEKDIGKVFLNEHNFIFSEAEINHLITKRLGDMNYPPVKDVKIYLKEGLIEVRGYSVKKFFKGKIELDIAPIQKQNRLALEVKKARFRNIYFPSFVASYILKEEMKETIDFLYSHPEYKKLELEALKDSLQLKYSN